MTAKPSSLFIISLLGALSVISPFAIDMYLPAYNEVAADLNVPNAVIALTLSSYFIGLAFGQVFYGPFLDRFGRKKPLCAGLSLFILASIACTFAPTIELLVGLRFVQALGGCVAGVASLAMVHDFFPISERAKILSRLMLFIAVSPLFAPTVGGAIAMHFGWHSVFVALAIIVGLILALIYFLLPEGHTPDATISLKPGPIITEYWAILRHPRFATYAFAGAFSFAGLFTYVAGSPIIFMDGFGLSATSFSMIFAGLAAGFIASSQLNVWLLKRHDSETLFARLVTLQAAVGLLFILGVYFDVLGLIGTLVMFFLFLGCVGITSPNAASLALAPFSKNAGSASAMLGFLQLGVGALISTGISVSDSKDALPIILILGSTALIGLIILVLGRERAHESPVSEDATH